MSQQLEKPARQPTRRPMAPPAGEPPRRKSAAEIFHETEDDSFFARHRGKMIAGVVVILAAGLYFTPKSTPSAPVRKAEKIISVSLPPPPPPVKPPPPPPPTKAPPPDKMEKETQPTEAKPKEAAPKKTDSPPPAALAIGNKGDGPSSGLAASGSGVGGGNSIGGSGTGGNSASKWGWYAGQVQAKITEALRQHAKTKSASISNLEVRIYPDASGRVTRVKIIGSTGNAALDRALESEVLTGLQLQEPPPAGMKLPINLRISARRQG